MLVQAYCKLHWGHGRISEAYWYIIRLCIFGHSFDRYRQVDGQTDRQTDRQKIDRQTDRQKIDRQTENRHTDRQTEYRQTDGRRKGGKTDRHTFNGRTDGQKRWTKNSTTPRCTNFDFCIEDHFISIISRCYSAFIPHSVERSTFFTRRLWFQYPPYRRFFLFLFFTFKCSFILL
jgi:hypothetical protein